MDLILEISYGIGAIIVLYFTFRLFRFLWLHFSIPSAPYHAISLFTPLENKFFNQLKKACDGDCQVLGKIRIADLVAVNKGQTRGDYLSAFNRIARKHVDFCLLDFDNKVLAVIELDDRSHERYDRQKRDLFVDRVFEEANIPMIHFPSNFSFKPRHIRKKIHSLL